MAVDVNALLDSALEKANAVSQKQVDLQKKLEDLQTQVDSGTLHPDQEKKIQDLVNLLDQLLK